MLEKKIQLKAFSDVKECVKAAEKCEYDVDGSDETAYGKVSCGRSGLF